MRVMISFNWVERSRDGLRVASCKTATDVRSRLPSIDSNRFRLARKSASIGTPAHVRRTLSRRGSWLVPRVRRASPPRRPNAALRRRQPNDVEGVKSLAFRALGVAIPQSLLLRADEVIQ